MIVTPAQLSALLRMINDADSFPKRRMLRMQVAAYLFCYGESVSGIAQGLGILESNAQELITAAFNQGICTPAFKGSSYEIQNAILGADLRQHIRDWLGAETPFRDVRVFFSSPQNPTSSESWDEAVVSFARFAGLRVHELLGVAKTVALTWGRTVSSIVNRVVELGPLDSTPIERVIPAWGEPLNHGENKSKVFTEPISCSALALKLQNALRPSTIVANPITLAGVPVMIPLTFDMHERRAIQKLFECSDDFVAVFGKDKSAGALDDIDTIITAVGAPEPPERFWSEAVFQSGQFNQKQRQILQKAVVGDIGGVWIFKSDISARHKAFLEKVAKHWQGIRLKHFQHCAQRAVPNGLPGVIACAVGTSRARVILESLRANLINELCIDFHLAVELLKLLEAECNL